MTLETVREFLAPNTITRIGLAQVLLTTAVISVISGIVLDIRANDRSSFQCNTSKDNKDYLLRECYDKYAQRYLHVFPLPIFLLPFLLCITLSIMHSLYVKPRVKLLLDNKENINRRQLMDEREEESCISLYTAYCSQIVVRILLLIIFLSIQWIVHPSYPAQVLCKVDATWTSSSLQNLTNSTLRCHDGYYKLKINLSYTGTVFEALLVIIGSVELIMLFCRTQTEIVPSFTAIEEVPSGGPENHSRWGTLSHNWFLKKPSDYRFCHFLLTREVGENIVVDSHIGITNFQKQMRRTILDKTETVEKLLPSDDVQNIKVENIFTNLVIQQGRANYNEFSAMPQSDILSSYPRHTGIDINRAEMLFMPNEDSAQNPRTILITGRAGIGKTMFMHKIARDWAKGILFADYNVTNNFKFVFLLDFIHLRQMDGDLSLRQLLSYSPYCPTLDEVTFAHIQNNPKGILVLMDGYDQFGLSLTQKHVCDPREINEPMPVPTLCAKLSAGKLLNGATIVITTRPEGLGGLASINDMFDRTVEILGFTPEKVEEFILKFFQCNEKKRELVKRHIMNNNNLLAVCYVPIICFIVCFYLSDVAEGLETPIHELVLPTTMTELYEGVLHIFLLKHHPEFKGKQAGETATSSAVVKETMNKLSYLALQLFRDKKFLFDKDDFLNPDFEISENDFTQLQRSSLLHIIPNCKTGPVTVKTRYCFLHLTLQEFLAARGLALQSKIPETVKDDWQLVVQFLAGLLRNVKDTAKATQLMKVLTEKIRLHNQSRVKRGRLLIIHCLHEYGNKDFAKQAIQQYELSDLSNCGFEDADSSAIAFLIANTNVERIDLSNNHKTRSSGFTEIANALPNSNLRTLSFAGNTEIRQGLRQVAKGNKPCKLTELNLDSVVFDFTTVTDIMSTNSLINLNRLVLSRNNITDEDVNDLLKALRNFSGRGNCRLKELSLRGNPISNKGAAALKEALCNANCENSVRLHAIDSNGNVINVQTSNRQSCSGLCHLITLNLEECHLTSFVLDALTEAKCLHLCNPGVLIVLSANTHTKHHKLNGDHVSMLNSRMYNRACEVRFTHKIW